MRYADASTKEKAIIIPPDQEQTTLAFKVSSASTSQNGGKKGRTKKTTSNNRPPSATKAPATLHSIPLSPTRQLKRPRYPRPSSSSHPDSAFRLPKGVPVISLLSDDDSDDAAIERWLSRPSAGSSSTTSSYAQGQNKTVSNSETSTPRVRNDSRPQTPLDETGEEGAEDVDQLSWSDEEGSVVPTHVARALKNKAAKQSRQQRNDRSSSMDRPRKRGRPSNSGRPSATKSQHVVVTEPSAHEARLLNPPALPASRWKHA